MIRRLLAGAIAMVAIAITLTGCGAVQTAARSFVAGCPETRYDELAWSPDGKLIAFTAGPEGGLAKIHVMNTDGTGVRRLNDDQRWGLGIEWVPDSQAILFHNHDRISTITLDGTITRINPRPIYFDGAQLSPDGTQIAYFTISSDFPNAVIHTINTDGTDDRALTNDMDVSAEWSPDGAKLAYVHYEGDRKLVSVMNADGTDQRHLVEGFRPLAWSPDGEWISAISEEDRSLRVIRPDGSGGKVITNDIAFNAYAWLPNSSQIAVVSRTDKVIQIIDVDTLIAEPVGTFPIEYSTPLAWSPDGARLAVISFVRVGNPNQTVGDITVMNRDGSGVMRLTENPGRYSCFNWPF